MRTRPPTPRRPDLRLRFAGTGSVRSAFFPRLWGSMTDDFTPTWEDVAHRYGRKIYNFAYRLTGNPDDAADLVQEVLLRVRKGLDSYRPGSFDGWLWRITRNAFLDGIRRKQRRPESALPEGDHHTLGSSPFS